LKTGFGFLYDENRIVCSYSDVKGAAKVQIQWDGSKGNAKSLLTFSESMDLAVLVADEEIPAITPIMSSKTLAIGDKVSYWSEKDGGWQMTSAAVHEILDTGKGYDLILIESSTYSSRSTPLYHSTGKIVGWVQGKRAIPMEAIATLAEKDTKSIPMSEVNRIDPQWKFEKPGLSNAGGHFKFPDLKMLSGSKAFPFKLELPEHWVTKIDDRFGKLHLRSSKSIVVIELRAMVMGSEDILAAVEHSETIIFPGFLRSELFPFSVDYVTGFRANYEDSDPINPYALQVFYTGSAQNFYILSVAYPRRIEEEIRSFVDQIFSSFRT
jgi:hypothetical protein